jgi:hypothetical protein
MGDIALARAQALEAARNACGNSVECRFYAKLMIDRYELVMREHGFEYLPADPMASLVESEEFEDDAPRPEPAPASTFAAVFARFYRALK